MRRRTLLASAATFALTPRARAAKGPVVLELFTSQGCSDCPAADKLMGVWAQRPDVIGLSWHVDYWDRLGWHDPFASRLSTERQRAYASRLGGEVFTPALVVDGGLMLIGSDRTAVEKAIAAAPPLPVSVRIADGVAQVSAAPAPVTLLFAAMDPEQETSVGAGENSGRRLREFQVVRESVALASWDGAARTVPLPPVANGRKAAVLLQSADLRVIGATLV